MLLDYIIVILAVIWLDWNLLLYVLDVVRQTLIHRNLVLIRRLSSVHTLIFIRIGI